MSTFRRLMFMIETSFHVLDVGLRRTNGRSIVRSALARELSEDGPDASRLRAIVAQAVAGGPPRKGGILSALRRSPLVSADLALVRPRESGR